MGVNRPKLDDFPYFPEGVDIQKGINLQYLKPGCPKPDCIPSIDNPEWLEENQILSEYDKDEELLGMLIFYNGEVAETYGFPISILNYHEIVNFSSNSNLPVGITYCPLCQTATAYIRKMKDELLILGVSGLLLNSALVLYDRESNSLISQVWSKGIVGQYSGKKLDQLPLVQTKLRNWIEKYPDTKILSKKTGFPKREKMYGKDHYSEYKTSEQIHFPVNKKDDLLHPKELVYIIEIEGTVWILQQSKLKGECIQHKEFYSISHSGGRLFFRGNSSSLKNSRKLLWDDWIPSGISYYFAARAYFPQGQIIE